MKTLSRLAYTLGLALTLFSQHPLDASATEFPEDILSNALTDAKEVDAIEENVTHYTSRNSTEAKVSFSAYLEVSSKKAPSLIEAKASIAKQLIYIISPLQRARTASVLGVYDLSNINILPKSGTKDTFTISYDYKGTMAVANSQLDKLNIFIPNTIEPFMDKLFVDGKIKCVVEEGVTRDFIWYHWFPPTETCPDKYHGCPAFEGCPIQQDKDYQKISAKVERIANTTKTYPEYQRYVDQNDTIKIFVFLSKSDHGKDFDTLIKDFDEVKDTIKPLVDKYEYKLASETKKWDYGVNDYVNLDNYLKNNLKFSERQWTDAERKFIPTKGIEPYYLTRLEKQTTSGIKIQIDFFFGETQWSDKSKVFQTLWKNAMENYSVILYDGHSGVGKNLQLNRIEASQGFKINIPKDKYQFILFASCVSYSYYPLTYFQRKATEADPTGFANLEVMTNGTESSFNMNDKYAGLIIRAIDSWANGTKTFSYQEIMGMSADYLVGIMGDDDNTTIPPSLPVIAPNPWM